MTAFGAVLSFRSQALFLDVMVLKADQALLDVVASKHVPRPLRVRALYGQLSLSINSTEGISNPLRLFQHAW